MTQNFMVVTIASDLPTTETWIGIDEFTMSCDVECANGSSSSREAVGTTIAELPLRVPGSITQDAQ